MDLVSGDKTKQKLTYKAKPNSTLQNDTVHIIPSNQTLHLYTIQNCFELFSARIYNC